MANMLVFMFLNKKTCFCAHVACPAFEPGLMHLHWLVHLVWPLNTTEDTCELKQDLWFVVYLWEYRC